jgi:hypothetical protein
LVGVLSRSFAVGSQVRKGEWISFAITTLMWMMK